jgi:RHS repeat-associated protein
MSTVRFCIVALAISISMLLISSVELFAQLSLDQTNIIRGVQSPTAASLGKFGDTPVNLYTGVPAITIPIYDAKSRSLELPLTLSYADGGGVRVGELPSWVGLGWSLRAGGVITRTVRDLPDEKWKGSAGVGYLYAESNGLGFGVEQNWPTTGNGTSDHAYAQGVSYQSYDSQPDDFFFDFGGHSGHFTISASGAYTIPYTNLKISWQIANAGTNSQNISSWTIITEDGTRYLFGAVETSNEYIGTTNVDPYNSSWYLTQVTSASGTDVINLTYNIPIAESVSYPLSGSDYAQLYRDYPPGLGTWFCDYTNSSITGQGTTYGANINTLYLQQIQYANTTIFFDISPRTLSQNPVGAQQLDRIRVVNSGSQMLEYDFFYSYFSSGIDPRLRLDSLLQRGTDNSTLPPYKFIYNTSLQLPLTTSWAQDHWGYFNGKNTNDITPNPWTYMGFSTPSCGVPMQPAGGQQYPGTHFATANRDPDPMFVQAGMLTRISYPTGGYDTLVFEPNTYSVDASAGSVVPQSGSYTFSVDAAAKAMVPQSASASISGTGYQTAPCSVIDSLFPNDNVTVTIQATIAVRSNPGGNQASLQDTITGLGYAPASEAPPSGSVSIIDANSVTIFNTSASVTTTIALKPGIYTLMAYSYSPGGYTVTTQGRLNWNNLVTTAQQIGGGVRIKSITEVDGMGNSKITRYDYSLPIDPTKSSGVLVRGPQETANYDNGSDYAFHISSSSSLTPLGTTQGSYIGYAQIKVSNDTSGYSMHRFRTAVDAPDGLPSSVNGSSINSANAPFGGSTSQDWQRGQEIQTSEFSSSGVIQRNTARTYYFDDVQHFRKVSKGINIMYFGGVPLDQIRNCYEVISAWTYLSSETVTEYDQTGQNPVVSTKMYYYDNPAHLQMTRLQETNSDGTIRVTNMRYPLDYSADGGTDTMAVALTTMIYSSHIVNALVERWLTETKPGQSAQVLSADLTEYAQIAGIGICPWKKLLLCAPSPLTDFSPSTILHANFSCDSRYAVIEKDEAHDSFGRLISVTDGNGNRTKLYYGSNSDPFNNSATGLNNAYLTGLERFTTGSSSLRTSASYDAYCNLSTIVDVNNGTSATFQYDPFQRLQIVKGPGAQVLKKYSYYLAGASLSAANPSRLSETLFRTISDSVAIRTFVNGLGDEIQKQKSLAGDDVVSATTYDSMRRPSRTYSAYQISQGAAAHSYDQNYHADAKSYYQGLGVSMADYPYSVTSYVDDQQGRPKLFGAQGPVFTVGGGHEVKHEYWTDPVNGRLKRNVRDENNQLSTAYVDLFGNTVQTVADSGGLNLTTTFTYDSRGKLLSSTPPNGSAYVSTYAYDTRGQLRQKSSPDAGIVKYRYDMNGNLRFQQDARQAASGSFTYQKFDCLNRSVELGEYTGNFTTCDSTTTGNPANDFPVSGGTMRVKHVYDTNISGDASARMLAGRLSCAATDNNGTRDSVFYSYDEFGRVEWQICRLSGLTSKKILYAYDWQGNPTQVSYIDNGLATNNTYFFYEYDAAGRLIKEYSGQNSNGTGKVQDALYTYLANGEVKRLQLGNSQGVDYLYNERGWLTQINHQNINTSQDPGHDGPGGSGVPYVDKFGMVIGYNNITDIGSAQAAPAQWNGNISWVMYNMSGVNYTGTGGTTSLVGYTFNYDKINRIRGADFGYYTSSWLPTKAFDDSVGSYDANGNIQSVRRYGKTGGMMDYLAYNYQTGTNRLLYITDTVATSRFTIDIDNQSSGNYLYNANGSMTKDVQGQIDTIRYDYRGLPLEIKKAGTSTYYRYNAEGQRVFKQTGTGVSTYYIPDAGGRTLAVVKSNTGLPVFNLWGNDHIGQLVVSYGAGGNGIVQGLVTPLVTQPRNDSRYYFLKDHLGSVRVTVDVGGNVTSYDDFYPFGMTMDGRSGNIGSGDARYKYTTKERDVESGYDYFGARYYDARMGRWMSVDPVAEKYPTSSPYVYSLNNPCNLIDFDGRVVGVPIVAGAALTVGEVTALTLGVGASLAIATHHDEIARGLTQGKDWINTNVNQPIIGEIQSGIDWIKSQLGTSIPIDQGVDGATPNPTDYPVGRPIPIPAVGGGKDVVAVHIVIPGTDGGLSDGGIHVQPIGGGRSHHEGVIIDPTKSLTDQLKVLTKNKEALKKLSERVQKALEQLKKMKEGQEKNDGGEGSGDNKQTKQD